MPDYVSLSPFAFRSSQLLRCGQRNPIRPLDQVTDYQGDTTRMAVALSTSQAACRQRGTAADVDTHRNFLIDIFWILFVHADYESGLDFPHTSIIRYPTS